MSIYSTIRVNSQDSNSIIWVENEDGKYFGIVDSSTILDEDGAKYEQDALTVIEQNFNCDIEQDFDNETSTIYTNCLGAIVFNNNLVTFEYE